MTRCRFCVSSGLQEEEGFLGVVRRRADGTGAVGWPDEMRAPHSPASAPLLSGFGTSGELSLAVQSPGHCPSSKALVTNSDRCRFTRAVAMRAFDSVRHDNHDKFQQPGRLQNKVLCTCPPSCPSTSSLARQPNRLDM